jgi:hypothetical protein
MGWLGLILLIVGFALVLPKGAMPGSAANRNVRMGGTQLFQTAGHRDSGDTRARSWSTPLIGAAMMAIGLIVLIVAG